MEADTVKLEYRNNNLTLKVLGADSAPSVLSFYSRNRLEFEKYETDKPDNFYTEEFIQNLLTAEYNSFVTGKHIRFFLYDENYPGQIIGTISFSDIKKGCFCSCNTGYKIDKNFQQRGYGRRMLTMALKIIVTELNMHRIEAYIAPDNTASAALARQLGFIQEGTAYSYVRLHGKWQDHLRFVYIS